jgi:hypothetical protein
MNRRTLIKSLAALPFLDVVPPGKVVTSPDIKGSSGAVALALKSDTSYLVVIDEDAIGPDSVFAVDKDSPLVGASILPLKVPAGKTVQDVFALYEIEGKPCKSM